MIKSILKKLTLSSALVLSGCSSVGPFTEIDAPGLGQETAQKAGPGTADLTAYVTGWVQAPANILINQKDERTPAHLKTDQWVPALAFAITHNTQGTVILDLGVKPGECGFGIPGVYSVPCENAPGSDLSSQLRADGKDNGSVKYIIPSHFHGDHVSGLKSFLQFYPAPLIMTEAAFNEMKSPLRLLKGFEADMLNTPMDIILADPYMRDRDLLGPTLDVFGDESLLVFTSPGHTDGHISAIVNSKAGTTLLTFDAAHIQANFELLIPSGSVSNADDARESLASLRKIIKLYNIDNVIFGHEPSQWCHMETAPLSVRKACKKTP